MAGRELSLVAWPPYTNSRLCPRSLDAVQVTSSDFRESSSPGLEKIAQEAEDPTASWVMDLSVVIFKKPKLSVTGMCSWPVGLAFTSSQNVYKPGSGCQRCRQASSQSL